MFGCALGEVLFGFERNDTRLVVFFDVLEEKRASRKTNMKTDKTQLVCVIIEISIQFR